MRRLNGIILRVLLLAALVSTNAFAFLANPATAEADKYAVFYAEQTAPLLSDIFTNTQSFYAQNNRCPGNNTFALNVSAIPTVIAATNYSCVASVTFVSQGVSPLVAGKTIAVGPSWMPSINSWSFSIPMIATNINSQQNLKKALGTCATVDLLAKSNSFISAYYSADPVATLQDTNNNCRATGMAGV